jgi:hypothetical protein
MVSVLAIGPKVRGFKRGRGGMLLRAVKILCTPSFVGEVKREVPCRKVLDMEISHGNMKKYSKD